MQHNRYSIILEYCGGICSRFIHVERSGQTRDVDVELDRERGVPGGFNISRYSCPCACSGLEIYINLPNLRLCFSRTVCIYTDGYLNSEL